MCDEKCPKCGAGVKPGWETAEDFPWTLFACRTSMLRGAVEEVGVLCRDNQITQLRADTERLQAKLDAILKRWQDGIGDIDNKWRWRMAELVGDKEGIVEGRETLINEESKLERLQGMLDIVKNGYNKTTGLTDVPKLCRNSPDVGCFCGCHISHVMKNTRQAAEAAAKDEGQGEASDE